MSLATINTTSLTFATVILISLASQLGQYEVLASPAPLSRVTTTSTEPPSSFVLEDPTLSAATSATSENTDEPSSEAICFRCFDKIQFAQDNVDVHEMILRKQKKLINRKKAAAEAAAAESAADHRPSSTRTSSNKFNSNRSSSVNGQNSTVRTRSLPVASATNEPIVVSRLRVGRSPPPPAAESLSRNSFNNNNNNNKDKYGLNKKDVELEKLKREQQQQKDKTCKALLEARDCLDELSRECIGVLQFHLYEAFTDQWYGKLRCPYPNNPNIKPFNVRSMADEVKTPIARPIPPSPEEVRKRMHEMLPDRQFSRPLGVILKPKYNDNNLNDATGSTLQLPRVDTTQQQKQPTLDQQQQLPTPPTGPYQSLMRDFSGHHYRELSQHHQRRVVDFDSDDSINMVNVGKILIFPCCFAIMVLLLALASLHYKTPNNEDDGENNGEKANPSAPRLSY